MVESQFLKRVVEGLLAPVKFQGGDFLENMFEKGVRVGLDIGASSVKIIEVEATVKGSVIKVVDQREFSVSLDAKGSVPQETLIIQSLVELWRSHKIKADDVRLVISDPAVYLRYLTIPRIERNELQKAIRWQIEKYVPFPIDNASVDYQIVESQAMKDKTDMGIIGVAVERKVIDKYLGILKAVKIFPSIIDIASFAVAKGTMAINAANLNETILIVDMGAKITSMVLIKGKTLLMVRNIETAGEQMTRMIAESCATDMVSAENLKRSAVLSTDEPLDSSYDKISGALREICGQWTQEIARSLTYCEREGLAETVDKIILCGGGAKLKGLDNFIANQLGLPVELADMAKHISCDKKAIEPLATQFLAAYGAIF